MIIERKKFALSHSFLERWEEQSLKVRSVGSDNRKEGSLGACCCRPSPGAVAPEPMMDSRRDIKGLPVVASPHHHPSLGLSGMKEKERERKRKRGEEAVSSE